MPYSRFLRIDHILTDLKAQTFEEAIVEILVATTGKDPDIDTEALVKNVLDRERMGSTALDNGIALPHAQIGVGFRPMILVARSKSGLRREEEEGKPPVHLVFMVLAQGTLTGRLLGRLRTVLKDPSLREDLLGADSADKILEQLLRRRYLARELEKVFSDPDLPLPSADETAEDQEQEPRKKNGWVWRLILDNPIMRDFAFFLGQLRISATLAKKLIMLTVSAGVVGGLGAIMFNWAIEVSMGFFGRMVDGLMTYPLLIAFVPAIGGLMCGIVKYRGGLPFTIPCATDGYVECVQHDGKVRPRVPFLLIIAASITIGSGGSCGKECPTAYIGSGLGAIAARIIEFFRVDKLLNVKLGRRDYRLLAMCGASAGLAAIFRAPIGAAIFVSEVLYEHGLEAKNLLPTILAGSISFMVFSSVYGFEALFHMESLWHFNSYNLVFAVIAGVASAAVGWFYVRFFYKVFHISRASTLPDWIKPAIGGMLHGCMIVFVAKELWGLGYGNMQDAINGHYGMWLLLILCFGKIISTAFTVATGGAGGVLAPSLYIGAMLGGFLGKVFELWIPNGTPDGLYVVIGMAALFASVGKVPFSFPILLMETTRNFSVILPVFIGTAVGYALAGPFKIYESQEPYPPGNMAGGFNALGETEADLLAPYPVWTAMVEEMDVIDEGSTVPEILRKFKESTHLFFPVQGRDGRYKGTISLDQMRNLIFEEQVNEFIIAADVANLGLPVVAPEESLAEVFHHFQQDGMRYLPVLGKDDILVGLLDRREVLRLLKHQILKRTAGVEYMGLSPWKKGVSGQ